MTGFELMHALSQIPSHMLDLDVAWHDGDEGYFLVEMLIEPDPGDTLLVLD